jgi:hypothetical protein
MTAVSLFLLHWLWEGPESFSARRRKLLEKVWGGVQTLFPDVDFRSRGMVMLVRIGYVPGIRHRTLRNAINTKLPDMIKCELHGS